MPPDIQPGGASEDRKWTVIVAAHLRDRLPRTRRTDPALRCSTKRPDKRSSRASSSDWNTPRRILYDAGSRFS